MQKALLIFAVIIIGSLFTIGSEWKFLIRPNLMAMLFFSFLSIQLEWSMIRRTHFLVVGLNIVLPIFFYFALLPVHEVLAISAFIITLIPTAVAAPILARIMQRDVGTVTCSVLLTTPTIAFATPLLLLLVLGNSGQVTISELVFPILSLIGIPLLLSQLIRWLAPLRLMGSLKKLGAITFPLFLLNLFIGCGDASRFIQENTTYSIYLIGGILATVAVVAVVQFQLGRWLGRKQGQVEFSLALGRKNTMLGVWLAITYFEPIIVMAPVFYILIQNIYNSIEMGYLDKKATKLKTDLQPLKVS